MHWPEFKHQIFECVHKINNALIWSTCQWLQDQILLRILWLLKRALSGWCVNQIICFFSLCQFFEIQKNEIWLLCCATAFLKIEYVCDMRAHTVLLTIWILLFTCSMFNVHIAYFDGHKRSIVCERQFLSMWLIGCC